MWGRITNKSVRQISCPVYLQNFAMFSQISSVSLNLTEKNYNSPVKAEDLCYQFQPSYCLSLTHKTTYAPSSTWCEQFPIQRWRFDWSVDLPSVCLYFCPSKHHDFSFNAQKSLCYLKYMYLHTWCGSERMQRYCLTLFKLNLLWDPAVVGKLFSLMNTAVLLIK